jgi:adenylate kinase family enzyme
MDRYLITGMTGTGKTTIAKELQNRGYPAHDTDRVKGLSAWIERTTGLPRPKDFSSAADWVDRYDWLWNGQLLQEFLNAQTQTVFFCGSSSNQENFYNLFTKVFLLEVDEKTLKHRILESKRDHEFGKRPGEIEIILGWLDDFQERTKALGATAIDAIQPLDQVINDILALAHDNQ